MQVRYEANFDDWAAAQIFQGEQSPSRRLGMRVKLIIAVCVIVFAALFAFEVHWVLHLCSYIVMSFILALQFQSSQSYQKLSYRRLLSAHSADFEQEEDKMLTCNSTPETIIISNQSIESHIRWTCIDKITICPQYLFISFRKQGCATLPRRALAEAEYQAFCEEVIRLYRAHASQEGKIADVVHSDWAIDFEKLRKKLPRKFSLSTARDKEAVCR